eukprot:1193809-Prorocentrum_minimum.AAC.3
MRNRTWSRRVPDSLLASVFLLRTSTSYLTTQDCGVVNITPKIDPENVPVFRVDSSSFGSFDAIFGDLSSF